MGNACPCTVADPGEEPDPLFLDKSKKKFLETAPPPFSKGLDDRPPPLSQYLDPALPLCVMYTEQIYTKHVLSFSNKFRINI